MPRPVVILYALKAEIAAIVPLLQDRSEERLQKTRLVTGTLDGRDTALVRVAAGGGNMEKLLGAVQKQLNPAAYLLTGFAGSADPALKTGTVVMPETLIDIDGKKVTVPDMPVQTPPGVNRDAVMVSVSRIYGPADKKKLYGPYSRNRVVDMESGPLAAWAARAGARYLVVKAVSDGFTTRLPDQKFIRKFFGRGQTGGDYLKAAVTSPLQFSRLTRLNKNCRLAAARLAPVVQAILGEID